LFARCLQCDHKTFKPRTVGNILIYSEDITKRKLALEPPRLQAMMFKSVQEGIVITDPQGSVIHVNPAFERITEYSLAEIRGKNMRFLHSGRHDRLFYQGMWKSIRETGNWQGEIWNRRKGGEIFLERIGISRVEDEKGTTVAYLGTFIDLNRVRHTQSELERLAYYDALTSLPNRLLLTFRLEHAIARARRDGQMGAVLFVDFDRFKQINDTLGHTAGDELLVAAAKRLRRRLREVDTLARLGGDEFVIVLEGIQNSAGAAKVAEDLIGEFRRPFRLSDRKIAKIGGCVGIALFPSDGDTAAQLIDRADTALYDAKRAGPSLYRFFGDHPHTHPFAKRLHKLAVNLPADACRDLHLRAI